MMKIFIIKQDDNLTEKVKRFFGEDMVESVHHVEVLNEEEDCNDQEQRDFAVKSLNDKIESFSNINDIVNLKKDSIIVDFLNGKSVFFSGGFFEPYDHDEMTKVKI